MSTNGQHWGGLTFEDLTAPQKEFLKNVIGNPQKSYFLRGCAGSGKTVIAAHAMSLLKKTQNISVGFLVYTKLLRKFVEDGFEGHEIAEDIYHFHDWYYRNRVFKDIFLIDECQDFKSEWIEAVRQNSKMQIWLGDDSQQIYEDATGFDKLSDEVSDSDTTFLNVNYRNSLFVAKFASKFIRLTRSDEMRGITLDEKISAFINPIVSNPNQGAGANNQPVVFIDAENRVAEFDAIVRIIRDIETNSKEQSRKIAIAHFQHEKLNYIEEELRKRGISIYRKSKDDNELRFPDFREPFFVLLSPIHSLKGLEADYIILPNSDDDKWRNEEIFNNLLFVLFTRARKRIYCSYVNKDQSFIYQAVREDGNNDFYQFINSKEIMGSGNPVSSTADIDAIIKKHFDEFNI